MANAPMVAAEFAPQWPAIAVETIPISGTVMFEMMLGMASRMMARLICIIAGSFRRKGSKNSLFFEILIRLVREILKNELPLQPQKCKIAIY